MSDSPEALEARVLRRVATRLVPLLMALYFVNYLDRTNLGIAKAEVSADLALSATMFGLASGIFFIGYVLVEVPSNLALARFGARRWLARIAVSWGSSPSRSGSRRTPPHCWCCGSCSGWPRPDCFPASCSS